MKRTAIGMLLLLVLTGCWDRLPLRDLHMVDLAGFDRDEESGDVLLDFIVTRLSKPGQGEGTPILEMTELKAPSLVEAVGKGEYIDQGPFIGIDTRMYLMSEKFISHEPVRELAFLLHAPYAAISSPIVVFDGSISKLFKTKPETKKEITEKINDLMKNIKASGTMPTVSLMQFILSREEPFEDMAMPLLKQSDSVVELSGALLFREGIYSGEKLGKEQLPILKFLLGKAKGKQKFTGSLSESGEFGYSVKKGDSKITIHPESGGLPKVNIGIRLNINAFYLGEEVQTLKAEYVNRIEKELSSQLEEKAKATIKTLQKANCDLLGIGKQIKAINPDLWKSLDWRRDYPRVSIEPKFDVQILNTDTK